MTPERVIVESAYALACSLPSNLLVGGELAWRQHDGGHTNTPNFPTFYEWAGTSPPLDRARKSNQRRSFSACSGNQENLNAQLKGGVRALIAPVDNLESNWAYMVMTALACNLNAWFALWPTEGPGRHIERHPQEKQTILGMEFKTFINAFLRLSCQIVNACRRLIYRLPSWNPWQRTFFRTIAQLRC
ncbi:MAG: hypothetical protein EXR98_04610 [Gemmataceae bacterium]|nr:hypothetical protein [Gemmataceae bacterium]